ncbi:hypothetical protein HQ590_16730, partial [bacterium]|nr:hypothetical protein [bacterium]
MTGSDRADPLCRAIFDAFAAQGASLIDGLMFGDGNRGNGTWPVWAGKMPLTWVDGDACSCSGALGVQVFAVSGAPVEPVFLDGRLVGHVYEDGYARYCRLGGLLPRDLSASRRAQVHSVYLALARALAACGMDLLNVVRTWVYLDRLLDWYDAFNEERTAIYERTGVLDHLVPASTGIGAGNPAGAAVGLSVIALEPKQAGMRVERVRSPLQCSAESYKSTFSRGIELSCPAHRTLYVSGTASIAPEGHTLHIGDTARQVA